jgi:uncharacterized membrane protein YdjX (TVP38/TMEM64 family)
VPEPDPKPQLPFAAAEAVRSDSVEPTDRGSQAPTRSVLKFVAASIVILIFIAAWRFTPLREYMADFHQFKSDLDRTGGWAPLIFTLVSALMIAMGVSRLTFSALGGAAFGFVEGFFYAQSAAMIGSYLVFLYVRWLGADLVRNRLKKYEKFGRIVQKNAFAGILVMRQLPMPGIVINLVLGLSSVRHSTFILASAIGFIPEGLVITLLGSSSVKGSLSQSLWQIALAIGLGIPCVLIGWKLRKQTAVNRELEVEIEQVKKKSEGK